MGTIVIKVITVYSILVLPTRFLSVLCDDADTCWHFLGNILTDLFSMPRNLTLALSCKAVNSHSTVEARGYEGAY